jgi:hypothetical protein
LAVLTALSPSLGPVTAPSLILGDVTELFFSFSFLAAYAPPPPTTSRASTVTITFA